MRTLHILSARIAAGAVAALLVVACAASPNDGESSDLGAIAQPYLAAGCATGAPAQLFARGMVGCPGSVAWTQRAALCAPGYHVASANDWTEANGAIVPTHDYWTNDDLHYNGIGTGSCAAAFGGGTSCSPGGPMHVCTPNGSPAGTDAEGNHCTWVDCGLTSTNNAHFGGCVMNQTAGALCVPNGCADGTEEQTLLNGIAACAGTATYANRRSLCAAGYRAATVGEWWRSSWTPTGPHELARLKPTHDYWTDENLRFNGTASSCYVDFDGAECPSGPMRICTTSGNDAEGNACTWTQCGYSSGDHDVFGGCYGNPTAGTVCAPAVASADTCAKLGDLDCFTTLRLAGWITRRASADAPCANGGKTGEVWLAEMATLLAEGTPKKLSLESEVESYLVPELTHGMFVGTEPFCVHTLYDDAYYTALNQGPAPVPPKASGDRFVAESADGTVRAYCMPTLLPPPSGCSRPEVGGCPKCFVKDYPADTSVDAP